ncbi:4Fe-4S binding protein [Clostridiisalibacter paucivorans]|uniref:4Fe-4S binding protein n=1 Tax=Clostridiisalibacter paucivorans TaxID=408753 RepID=UPI00047C5140|nr:4Fe-4S binding protein [Clostridiisalibacter paucivorans]
MTVYYVDHNVCRKCKMCLRIRCKAISYDEVQGAQISEDVCNGCGKCSLICPMGAIKKVGG